MSTQPRPATTGQSRHNFITIADACKLVLPHIHRALCNYRERHYCTLIYKSPPALTFTFSGTRPRYYVLPSVASHLLHLTTILNYFHHHLTSSSIHIDIYTRVTTDVWKPLHHHGTRRCSPRVSNGLLTPSKAVAARSYLT